MVSRQTPAVVLHIADHGDADKIVTFYCPEHGKITGIAKGAKRSKKRFVNKLELFSLLDISYDESRRSSLKQVRQAELIESFPALRQHYRRYTAASLLCELLLHWTRENDGDNDLFGLLLWALDSFDRDRPLAHTVILFEIKMLDILGYRPHLAGCLGCGALTPAAGPYHFSASRSGLICRACNKEANHGHMPLSLQTAKLLLKAQHLDRQKLDRLHFSPTAAREAISLLRRYDRYLLQREIQSWNFFTAPPVPATPP